MNLAPTSNSPETNWDEADASISISPPATSPVLEMVNGRASPVTDTPRDLRESIVVFIGRLRAAVSPSKVISPLARAATPGTNLITVPARPQSIEAGPLSGPGVTTNVVPEI